MNALDAQTLRIIHADRVHAMHRAAGGASPRRRRGARRFLGRSLVVLGVRVARDPLLEVRFERGRPAASPSGR